MRLSVSEMAKLCGVSVRTLHHYDHIGLLHPETAAESGYRWYGQADVARMQEILFFRELDFPLKEIAAILADPNYDRQAAMHQQKTLLTMKRDRLNGLLSLLEENLKGEQNMSFSEFDVSEIERCREKYAAEVKERWGDTEAYRESEAQAAKNSGQDWADQTEEMNDIFRGFAGLRGTAPASPAAKAQVKRWQDFITAHFYRCTDEVLAGLGQMYTADQRFCGNLDRFGAGTALFMSEAIAAYCAK